MQARLTALRENALEAGFDAFFSLSPPDNFYLTGFRGSASAVVVTGKEAVFLCDFRYTEQAGQQVQGFDVQEVSGSLEAAVGARLKDLGAAKAGFNGAGTSVSQADAVGKAYEGDMGPANGLMAGLRLLKKPEEVDAIRAASNLAEGAFTAVLAGLSPKMTERDFAAELEAEFKRRGAERASFDTIALFGPRSSLPHGVPGNKRPDPGDVMLFDLGCKLEGYCSDLTRTYVYGTIPAWFEEIHEITLMAQEAALAAVRPGIPCIELDDVARGIIRDAGYGDRFGHGLGHGVGIEVHEGPRLSTHGTGELKAGMVVTIEPGIYLPGRGGVRIEDLVVVTGDGCEVLTSLPKHLEVLKV